MAGLSSQRLRASDHAICAVYHAATTWELDEVRVIGRIHSSRAKAHIKICIRNEDRRKIYDKEARKTIECVFVAEGEGR